MRVSKGRSCLALMLLLVCAKVAHAQVTAHLSRSIVYEGEQITLTIRAEGSTKREAPDLSPLETDFEVLGTSKSEQFRSINGQTSHSTEWTIGLVPRKLGKLNLPPLSVGQEVTYPLQLEVIAIDEQDPNNQAPLLFIDTQLDNNTPYVQQQTILTVKLYIGAELKEGTLSEPSHSQFVFEPLGEQKRYDEIKYGIRYSVVERRYALFAQQSGDYDIEPILFSGTIIDPDSRVNTPNFGANGWRQFRPAVRKLTRKSPEIPIKVQPKPSQVTHHWMPATSVKLSQSWSQTLDDLKLGEPLTRTLNIEVVGQRASQIKNIELEAIEGWQIYPDQAVTDTQISTDGVTGVLQRKFAMVPERPGEIQIPALRIHWWDIISDQPRTAELQAQSVQVMASQLNAHSNSSLNDNPIPLSRLEMEHTPLVGAERQNSSNLFWKWLALFALVGWIVTLGFFWFHPKSGMSLNVLNRSKNSPKRKLSIPSTISSHAKIFKALEEMDAPALKESLIIWSRNTFPEENINTLTHLADFIQQQEFKRWIRKLESSLYSQKELEPLRLQKETIKLWLDREIELHDDKNPPTKPKIPPLYPIS